MANRKIQSVSPIEKEGRNSFLEHLISILDRYLGMFPQHESLTAFMKDEKQMYDENGNPSEQYQEWIRRFNEFCKENPIEDCMGDLNPNQLEVLKGAREYLNRQKELRESYRASNDKDEWLTSVMDTPEKRQAFDQLLHKSILKGMDEINNIKSKK